MRRQPLLLLLATGFIFNACKVSKDIALPVNASPANYRHATSTVTTTVTTTDTSSLASIPWNDFFKNRELQQLIDSTLANNFDMQLALKNREAAQLLLKQSRLAYLPQVGLQAAGSVNRPSDNSLNGISLSQFLGKSYVEDYSLNATASWEADIWGKIKSQQSKALAIYLQTDEAKKAVRTDLVASAAKGYYQLLMLDEQLAIAKKNLLLSDSTLSIVKLQYQAGQVTALAVQQYTAQYLAAKELLPDLEKEILLGENYLSVLSGMAPGAIKRSGNIYERIASVELSTGIPSALLSNRPDVKLKELDLVIANANTAISKAAMYPSLGITATGGVNAFLASNWFSIPASLFVTTVAGITQPLFMQGKLKTQYHVSELEREKTVIAFRQSVVRAAGEVSNALVKVEKIKEQQQIAQTRVATLQQGIGNAKMLFSNGMANYLEVITAQNNVLLGELALAQLQEEQSTAVIELYRSLGGGWR